MFRTLFVILVGASGIGKSTLLKIICALFPANEITEVSFLSKAAFLKMGDLRNRVVVVHESLEDRDLTRAVRQLVSEEEVRCARCSGDKLKEYVLKGPVALIETTTEIQNIEFQKRNRALCVHVELSVDASNRRLEAKKAQWVKAPRPSDEDNSIRDDHRSLQAGLDTKIRVDIPYAEFVGFESYQPHSARLLDTFLRIVAAIAFLDQRNRDQEVVDDDHVYIQATFQDFTDAYDLFHECLIETGSETLSEKAGALFADLSTSRRFHTQDSFTRAEIVNEIDRWTPKTIIAPIKELTRNGFLDPARGRHGQHRYRFSDLGYDLSPESVFVNCYRTLTPPTELRRLFSLSQRAL